MKVRLYIMKKIIILTVILCEAFVLMQSCKESSIYPNLPPNGDDPNLIDSGYYPNVPGSYWRYNIILSDSIPLIIDSVEIRLVTNEEKPDSSQFLTYNYYHFKFGDIYSTYESLKKDSLIRFNNPNIPYKSFLLIPFKVGQIFTERYNDTTYNTENITIQMSVESFDSISVTAGRFKAFKIVTTITYERFGTAPFYTRENLYFVPYIGFIKIENEFWDDNYLKYISKEVWELTDYNIIKKK